MKNPSVFDILGPIMVGPSSSHTAGAARLGKVARSIAGEDIKKVTFLLHGSFAKTYKGHGTDRALLAGILGMEPSDARLRDAIVIAKNQGLEFEFVESDLGDVHPNTVKFLMETEEGTRCDVMGSSIGGGSIVITEVNSNSVEFTGEYPTLIISNIDVPGVVSKVTTVLSNRNINIAFMKVFRSQKGKEANMVFEVDHKLDEEIIEEICSIDSIKKVININPVTEDE